MLLLFCSGFVKAKVAFQQGLNVFSLSSCYMDGLNCTVKHSDELYSTLGGRSNAHTTARIYKKKRKKNLENDSDSRCLMRKHSKSTHFHKYIICCFNYLYLKTNIVIG